MIYPVNPEDSLPELIVCAANKDPETQVVLALMENDLLELIDKAMIGKMNEVEVKWANKSACCVVLAAVQKVTWS